MPISLLMEKLFFVLGGVLFLSLSAGNASAAGAAKTAAPAKTTAPAKAQPVATIPSACAKAADDTAKGICNEYSDSADFAEACVAFSQKASEQIVCFRNAKSAGIARACRAATKEDYLAARCLTNAKSPEHAQSCADYYKPEDFKMFETCLGLDNAVQVKTCADRTRDVSEHVYNEKINCLNLIRYETNTPVDGAAQPKS